MTANAIYPNLFDPNNDSESEAKPMQKKSLTKNIVTAF